MLLDEPFGSLDAQVRKELRQWLRRFHDDLHITSLFVTHDQEEALEVADRVVIMNQGKIEQIGTPEEVYQKPVNAFVLNFLGKVNLFHGRVEDGKVYVGNTPIKLPGMADNIKSANVYIRPHQFEITLDPVLESTSSTVQYVNPAGSMVKLDLVTETGVSIQVEIPQKEFSDLKISKNDRVYVRPKQVTFHEYEI